MPVFRDKSEKDSVTNPTKYDSYAIFLTLMSKYAHFVALFIFVLMIQVNTHHSILQVTALVSLHCILSYSGDECLFFLGGFVVR